MRLRPAILLGLSLVLWGAGPARASEVPDREAGLADLPPLVQRQRTFLARLDEVDRQLAELRASQRRLKKELSLLKMEEQEAGAEAGRLETRESGLRSRLRVRLKALYLHGRTDLIQAVPAGRPAGGSSLERTALARMVRFDLKLIEDYNRFRYRLAEVRGELDRRRAEMDSLNLLFARAEDSLSAHRRARAELLLRLDQEGRLHDQALKELDQAAARLNQELAVLEGRLEEESERPRPRLPSLKGPAPFSRFKGRLEWPLEGNLSRMDDPRRHGVLIEAPEGRPVKTVGGGRVVFSGWIKGYGLVIIIDHGERYYTLLAHLEESEVKVGQGVEAGQEVGLSGRAGLARSGVYFEIRHQDQALDPAGWLAGGSG